MNEIEFRDPEFTDIKNGEHKWKWRWKNYMRDEVVKKAYIILRIPIYDNIVQK